jgi:ABC-2 type transport system permease protein
MSKIMVIAKWEFIEKIRTKSFIISLFLTPAIIFGFSIVPALLANEEAERTEAVGILDPTGIFFRGLNEKLGEYYDDSGQPAYIFINLYQKEKNIEAQKRSADSLIVKGILEGVLFISDSDGLYSLEYRSMNTGDIRSTKRFENAFNELRIEYQLVLAGVERELVRNIIAETDMKTIRIDQSGKETESGFFEIFFTSLVFIMILIFVILSSGGLLIRSLVEEKSNRLIEIIVSSCKPEELLTGKILGLGLLALVQIIIWGLFGTILAGAQLIPVTTFDNILPMFFYFLLGFLFYTSLFVGIGSVVSTEQEAQQVTGYLTIILFLPIIFSLSAIQNPDSAIVKILTYIPFTTPTVMLLKYNIKPVPLGEIISTMSLLVVSIVVVVIITSKIFRIGILSYGKMPGLKEIFHWIKED